MKNSAELTINQSFIDVFKFLDDENTISKLDPKVVSTLPVNITEGIIGSTYVQKYKEGRKIIEYVITTTKYSKTDDKFEFGISFQLMNHCLIDCVYLVEKLNDSQTKIYYETNQKPLSFMFKVMHKVMPKSLGNKTNMKHLVKIDEVMKAQY